jgi:predicted nucleotidyltransferase
LKKGATMEKSQITGITERDWGRTDEIIDELKNNKEVEAIYLFGSYARDTIKPFSDIDICVVTERNISKGVKEEILHGGKKVYRIAKGDVKGEDVYLALGRSRAGRYLSVFFILKRNRDVLPISARNMDSKERRRYGDE